MTKPRDSQKTKFQAAFEQFYDAGHFPKQQRHHGILITKIKDSSWFKKKEYHGSTLCLMPRYGMVDTRLRDLDDLHTQCHALVNNGGLHDAAFCSMFKQGVLRWYGPEAARDLRAAYKEHGVKARVVSDETRSKQRDNWLDRKAPDAMEAFAKILENI